MLRAVVVLPLFWGLSYALDMWTDFGRILSLLILMTVMACSAEAPEASVAQLPTALPTTSIPTAAPTIPATSMPTPTTAPTNTAQPTATASPTETATAEPSAVPTETSAPTQAATATASATAQPLPTSTLMPTLTPAPSQTPTPEPTATPLPSPTAEPTEQTTLWLMGFDSAADTGSWFIVNDTVMGGVSTADGYVENSILTFYGNLSLDNNGGFTSIRRGFSPDLSGYTGIQMRLRGDGRSYYLRLTDNSDGRETNHEQLFTTRANEWTTVTIRFDQLSANFRGFAIERPSLDPSTLRGLGIMLREKNPGPFQLEIDWMQAYK